MTATTLCDPLQALPEHESWLRSALHARLGSRDEVEEVMQEVAIAAAKQSARDEVVECVGAWLYRVAIRQVLQFRRKAGRQKKLLIGFATSVAPTDEDARARSPIEFLLSEERQSEVRVAMSRLSERDRQLLMLKYVEGMSYGDIAQFVGVSAAAVQSRLHRARASLRALLRTDPRCTNDF
ncbi:MAG: RNA polymerase sigma factor [Planctomycetales bacterium]|nr:RNA polymerase sigma factor [Planctomycetales bacterium]